MSKKLKFCPNCGSELGGAKFCPECGYDTAQEIFDPAEDKSSTESKTSSSQSQGSSQSSSKGVEMFSGKSNPVWDFAGSYMPEVGKWLWVPLVVVAVILFLIYLFSAVVIGAFGFSTADLIWAIIRYAAIVVLTFVWVIPRFSKKMQSENYQDITEDVLPLGNIRIPWSFIMAALFTIFGWEEAWFGLILWIPALIIIFFGPSPYRWTTEPKKTKQPEK